VAAERVTTHHLHPWSYGTSARLLAQRRLLPKMELAVQASRPRQRLSEVAQVMALARLVSKSASGHWDDLSVSLFLHSRAQFPLPGLAEQSNVTGTGVAAAYWLAAWA
jgi:hypothetical protein